MDIDILPLVNLYLGVIFLGFAKGGFLGHVNFRTRVLNNTSDSGLEIVENHGHLRTQVNLEVTSRRVLHLKVERATLAYLYSGSS